MFFKDAKVELVRLPMPERDIHYDLLQYSSAVPLADDDPRR